MDLLGTIKGNHYLARESKAEDFREGFETSVCFMPCARRRIDYKVVKDINGRKLWQETGRYEYVYSREISFVGRWEEGWKRSDEELMQARFNLREVEESS